MDNKLVSSLEALLFIYGEPIDIKKAAQVLHASVSDLKAAASSLAASLQESGRGLVVIQHGESLQLGTRPDLSPLLEKVLKAELHEALTSAAIETLSVIAYGGPVLRSEIDYIRGVNSSFILRSLLLRGLIDRGSDPRRSNAYVYTVSFDFLKHIGLTRIEELPEYEKYRDLAKNVKPIEPTQVDSATPAIEEVGDEEDIEAPASVEEAKDDSTSHM